MNKALNPTVYCEIHYNKKHGTNQTLPRSGQTEWLNKEDIIARKVSKKPDKTLKTRTRADINIIISSPQTQPV